MFDKEFIIFGSPAIGEEEIAEVEAVMRSGWLGTGPRVAKFEEDFAIYQGLGAQQVAAVNSCTAALHVSMIAANLEPGSEVITTPLTFCATVNAAIHAGLNPVMADINPTSHNIDPIAIEAAITSKTRAIIPVHFAGRACDMQAIMAIANKHQLTVIEDCAHAIETTFHGKKAGTFGDFGCYSFYSTKNVVTGEGGMITGRNAELIARAKVLALHGMSKDAWHRFGDKGYKHYQVIEAGFKYNMMDLQAAIGLHQLRRVEANWQRRAQIWNYYQQALVDLPINRPAAIESNTRHAYHLYTIGIDEKQTGISRDAFLDAMNQRKIGTGVHYLALTEHPYYQQRYGWRPEQTPYATQVGRSTVSLPISAKLTDSDVERIVDAIKKLL